MDAFRRPLTDHTPALLAEGYAWLPNRMRESPDQVLHTRLMGRPALAVRGRDAVRFFYDERNVRRHGVVPEPVLSTLFGHGGVQTFDGVPHRVRRELFLPLMAAEVIDGLVGQVAEAWDESVSSWGDRDRVVLFEETGVILTRAVCRWTGTPLADRDARPMSRDLLALVDGFATLGPRHWRARRGRRRQEDRLTRLVDDVRSGRVTASANSTLEQICGHGDAEGLLLDPRTAAVELLNVLRPTVAVSCTS